MSRKKGYSTKLGLIAILALLLLLLAQDGHFKWSVAKAYESPAIPEAPLSYSPSSFSEDGEHDHSWMNINNKVVLTNLRDRVGIGLNNPSNKLHILKKLLGGSTLKDLQIKIENPNRAIKDRLSGIALVNRDSSNKQIFSGIYSRKINANEIRLELSAGRKSKFDLNKPADVVIKSNGNVGIGTLFPQEKLEVEGVVKANKLVIDELCVGGECFQYICPRVYGQDPTYFSSDYVVSKNPCDLEIATNIIGRSTERSRQQTDEIGRIWIRSITKNNIPKKINQLKIIFSGPVIYQGVSFFVRFGNQLEYCINNGNECITTLNLDNYYSPVGKELDRYELSIDSRGLRNSNVGADIISFQAIAVTDTGSYYGPVNYITYRSN